ncbi:hypothetical protein HELRODRAFT_192510 [Helobdella robusta]|uniref:FH2 domain-containing protein n=1 Tax=Helobdella robusta TaxID=6412 RepID=T1FU14_HELRO|nr:hypothetical protein HELRODRAFT_192510 [Helobdella robusta]ESO00975.1 hypothetical protein HELRODRAFT_192510 [Helobdella robusta]
MDFRNNRNKKPTSILDKFSSLRSLEKRKKSNRYNDVAGENLQQLHIIQQKINQLSEHDVQLKFEQMLDDMNLSDEKKAPLRLKTTEQKRAMLAMHFKGSMLSHSKVDTVDEFIYEMNRNDLRGGARYGIISSLRVALTNNPVSQSEKRSTLECIKCLSAYSNNKYGLMQLIKHDEALVLLCRCVDVRDAPSMLEAVKLIAAISLVPPDGLDKVLEAISICGELRCQERFLPIVQGLNLKDIQIKIACLQLTNAIISTADELHFRLHLRNEFLRNGLIDLLPSLERHPNDEIQSQVRIFLEHKDYDAEEFSHRYDNLRLDMDDPRECFELLMSSTVDTPSENYFLSILQHLLIIREDSYARPQYYQLIEECVTQIVLHRNGCDPDFRYNRRFHVDVEPLLGKLSSEDSCEFAGSSTNLNSMLGPPRQFRQKLEEVMTIRQELEAKVGSLEAKVKGYEEEIQILKSKISGDIGSTISSALLNNIPSSSQTTNQTNVPVPPPPPFAGIPFAPPIPGSIHPPPPPIAGLHSSVVKLPDFVKPKKKYNPSTQMKRANWVKINPSALQPDSFWLRLDEEKFASVELFNQLTSNFAFKTSDKPESSDPVEKAFKKVKELKVLDSKSAQNLSILLGSIKVPYEEIKRRILQVDESKLTLSFIDQLIKLLPPRDQINKLALLKDHYQELSEPEQFAVVEMVASLVAMEEVRNSTKLADVMGIILLLGNYMNAGSRNEQTIGFEMNFISKLVNTKSTDNSQTLMHFMVQYVQNHHPPLIDFYLELSHVEKAARVSEDLLQKAVVQMCKQVEQLDIDLKNAEREHNSCKNNNANDCDDRFVQVMTPFLVESSNQCSLLEGMHKNMLNRYQDISKYFCYDYKRYSMEEMFADLKLFIEHFQQAKKDLDRLKEQEEKMKRQKEMLMRQEEEREEKRKRKKMIIDINADDDQEGVMDNLLEALKTGSAFHVSRERKERRKNPRIAGAERRAQLVRSRSRQNVLSPQSPGLNATTSTPSTTPASKTTATPSTLTTKLSPQQQQQQFKKPHQSEQQRKYKEQHPSGLKTILFHDDDDHVDGGGDASLNATIIKASDKKSPKPSSISSSQTTAARSNKPNTQRTQFTTQQQQQQFKTSSSPSTSFKKTSPSKYSPSPSSTSPVKMKTSNTSPSSSSKYTKQMQQTTNYKKIIPTASSSSQPPPPSSSSQPQPSSSSSPSSSSLSEAQRLLDRLRAM